jgi:hypothetical protein
MDKRKVFECLIEMCRSAGGDGDSALVSPNYKEWADEFEIYLQFINDTSFKRQDDDGCTSFGDNQENIHFMRPDIEPGMASWTFTDGKITMVY